MKQEKKQKERALPQWKGKKTEQTGIQASKQGIIINKGFIR
jgi:hypothetical protein